MYFNMWNLLPLAVVVISSLQIATLEAYYVTPKQIFTSLPARCQNPNGRNGICISIHQCESLKYVLRNRMEAYYKFVRLSMCDSGAESTGSSPFVCCTHDTHFVMENQPHENGHRIIFPSDSSPSVAKPVAENKVPQLTVKKTTQQQYRQFPKPPDCGAFSIDNRIYGGIEAELTEFSWMVNLEYRTAKGALVSVCAGSIINERYILTAAHCIRGNIEKKVGHIESVRLGEHNTATEIDCNSNNRCTQPTQRVGIESIAIHPGYEDGAELGLHQHNDIALIRLERTINFTDSIQAACLPSVEPIMQLRAGLKLTVAGWGHNGTAIRTHEKRKVSLPIVDQQECRIIYSNSLHLSDEQLCAGGIYKHDSCSGDSGGPLMRLSNNGWILEGIVSFGRGCGLEQPGVYTRISKYMDWIERNVVP